MNFKRFRDIPPLMPRPVYECDVPWTFLEQWVAKDDQPVDFDPEYQRGHVWSKTQQITYVEFCLRGGTSARNIMFNAPGFRHGKRVRLEVVDGKQRLTAILAFMRNEIPAFGTRFKDYEDSLGLDPHSSIRVNIFELGRQDVLKFYLDLNSGGTVHTADELDKVRKMLGGL